jgi:hypothetical protein
MAKSPLDAYRSSIEHEMVAGKATEHTHRPALKTLIESLAPGVTATNEPKHVECGAPDFAVWRAASHGPMTVGYAEAKDIGTNLDEVEKSEQMRRYLPALPNLVLTDYLEFRWYVHGERRESALLARVAKGGKLVPEKGGAEGVGSLLAAFLRQKPGEIDSPKELALRMARLTHLVRDVIVEAFEKRSASSTLLSLHRAFEAALIPDLPVPEFADMFAQTLAYGLFAARCNHKGPSGSFRRFGAAREIPKTNPFLRQLFDAITGAALDDEPYARFVDDLAQLLAVTDVDAVLEDFGRRGAREDPVVHFYETFLAAYDPTLREARGVYYTPEPVVWYIVRSADTLLKSRFGCSGGLADTRTVHYEREQTDNGRARKVQASSPQVLILDPACGTGTFLYAVVDQVRAEFIRQGNAGMWSGYVREHLLPRLFGFELLMAPYAVAHLKLGMQLAGLDLTPAQRATWSYDFSGHERLGIYLTNTLEQAFKKSELVLGQFIAEEGNAAAEVKRELPIMVVLGNPPYSGHSFNRSSVERTVKRGKRVVKVREKTFIGHLIEEYKYVDGTPLGERNPKWLQNDYVKFLRFGQWRVEKTGAGILAFITDNSYLDNPTFRGMRRHLMKGFTEIYLLNLHGNSRKKEKCPDGSEDKNVFDIQQGVAISVFLKAPGAESQTAKVYYADLWGPRDVYEDRDGKRELVGGKYHWLWHNEVATTAWTSVEPRPPLYLFVPQAAGLREEYERGWKVTDMMPVNVLGFQTHRDHFAIDFDESALRGRIGDLRGTEYSDEELRSRYRLVDNRDWQLASARDRLRAEKEWERHFLRCVYRPFDQRWCYFSTGAMDYPRRELLLHVAGRANLCLNTVRQTKMDSWQHAVVSNAPTPALFVELKDGSNAFPLYLYGGDPKGTLFEPHVSVGAGARRANLSREFIGQLSERQKMSFVADGTGDLTSSFGPEDVFHYAYAVLNSPTYRARYKDFLKTDFPRLPATSDKGLFRALCAEGAKLVALHLLQSPALERPCTRYPVAGPNAVESGYPKYRAPGEQEPGSGVALRTGRVYISAGDPVAGVKAQYFENIPPEVWKFCVGGYQVCEQWLKDRRGRSLSYDDLTHYQKVLAALKETIRLTAEIDGLIPRWPLA